MQGGHPSRCSRRWASSSEDISPSRNAASTLIESLQENIPSSHDSYPAEFPPSNRCWGVRTVSLLIVESINGFPERQPGPVQPALDGRDGILSNLGNLFI